MKKMACAALLALLSPLSGLASSIVIENFAGTHFTPYVPPDMGGAVGPDKVVQFVNGRLAVFAKSGGAALSSVLDTTFWQSAGIPAAVTNPGLSDPRVIYDPGTQRFFVTEINVSHANNVGNQVLLAVSNTANPLDGFKAASFSGYSQGTAPLADFPTLGVDQNGIYIGVNNFNGVGTGSETLANVALFSIPKASFVATQSLASMTRFDNLNPNVAGFTLQAANTAGASGTVAAVNFTNLGYVNLFRVNGAAGPGATLGNLAYVGGLQDGFVNYGRQPDGTRTIDTGGDNFNGSLFQQGQYLYASNTLGDSATGVSARDMVHWMIFNTVTQSLVAQGVISDPAYDFYYPSIAANAKGDFMLAYNRSGGAGTGSAGNISAFAQICHGGTSGTVSCEDPLLLMQGLVGNYFNAPGGSNRWGDYSAAQLDPVYPNTFWAFLEYPATRDKWATRIAAIAIPEPPIWLLLFVGGWAVAQAQRTRAKR